MSRSGLPKPDTDMPVPSYSETNTKICSLIERSIPIESIEEFPEDMIPRFPVSIARQRKFSAAIWGGAVTNNLSGEENGRV
jgi:hypothetical protein